MDSSSGIPPVYQQLFNEQMPIVREIFSKEGIEETIIKKFEETWICKLRECGADADPNSVLLSLFDAANSVPLSGMDVEGTGVDAEGTGVDAEESGMDPKESGMDSEENGMDADKSGSSDPAEAEDGEVELSEEGESKSESLNSNDDIIEVEEDTDNIIVCQFVAVKRVKDLWKINLRSGIMQIEGKDYIFGEAFGTVKW